MPIIKIIFVLSSILSLISCNSDNTHIKPDEWPTPEILISSRVEEGFSVKSEDEWTTEGISSLDKIEFLFSKDSEENEKWSNQIDSLKSQVQCFLPNNKEYSVHKEFQSKKFLLITQILPNQIVLSEHNGFDCDITIVLTNSIGSTRTYNLRRSKVFIQRDQTQLRMVDKNQNTITNFEPTNGEGENNYLFILPKKLDGTWRLVCEHFTSSTPHYPHKQMDLLQLIQLNPVVESADEYAMEQNPVQRCKVEFETTKGELLISPVFKAVVSYLMLSAKIIRNFNYAPPSISFGNYVLVNPYPFSLVLSIDPTSYARLEANYIHPSAYANIGYTFQHHSNETLNWSLINTDQVKLINSNPVTFEIPAGGEAHFHLKASTPYCDQAIFKLNLPNQPQNQRLPAHLSDITHYFRQDTIHFYNVNKHSGISSKIKVSYIDFDASSQLLVRHQHLYSNKKYTKPVNSSAALQCL